MNFTKAEIENFGSRLSSLGGRLGFEKYNGSEPVDIEKFLLDATRFIFVDDRLARCIENWVRHYAGLIHPSELLKLLKEGYPYDEAVLGVFMIFINDESAESEAVRKYCKPKNELTSRLNDFVIKIDPGFHDPDWLKFNIISHIFVEEYKKYLINPEYVFKNSPEMSSRVTLDYVMKKVEAFKGCVPLSLGLEEWYVGSKSHPGFIEKHKRNGEIIVGRFKGGKFHPKE